MGGWGGLKVKLLMPPWTLYTACDHHPVLRPVLTILETSRGSQRHSLWRTCYLIDSWTLGR